MKFWLIVPAAGVGARMAADRPKQYLEVAGKSILEHTLSIFLDHPQLHRIILPVSATDEYWPDSTLAEHPAVFPVSGGLERADSVLNGLQALPGLGAFADDWVLVHDAARPLLAREDLQKLLDELQDDPVGGLLAYPVRDTLKAADAQQRVSSTVPREAIWHALTPQMFRLGMLEKALAAALQQGVQVTDEASAMEWAGYRPRLIAGQADNLKITRPEDLRLFRALLAAEQGYPHA